jgi:hypothetical protein
VITRPFLRNYTFSLPKKIFVSISERKSVSFHLYYCTDRFHSRMTSLSEVDAEIKRLTDEIEKLEKEVQRPVSPPPRAGVMKQIVPQFVDLPDIQNIKIPTGFERAPITCPYDPSKAERLVVLEEELRESLQAACRTESLTLVKRILDHQAKNKILIDSSRPESAPRRVPARDDVVGKQVLNFLINR